MKRTLIFLLSALVLAGCGNSGFEPDGRWTAEKANAWYEATGWRNGCNFVPSNAINQIEMWQSSTFDAATIDKELGWAEELGFNTMRVFLSSVVWKNEPDAFKANIDKFLTICSNHGIAPVFVIFDDCWNAESEFGPQPEPKTGIHNSGWIRDPAHSLRQDTTALFPVLEAYEKDILTTFKKDSRILWWDLYNEPGNSSYGSGSLPLVKHAFEWAREVRPSQPVSIGVWTNNEELNQYQLDHSDIISYHNYSNAEKQVAQINKLKEYGRPIVCTEYMARTLDCTFQGVLPVLKENNVSAINWGFVAGKTNTIFAWSHPMPEGGEPEVWFHDIYRQDKTPFCQEEIDVIKKVNGK